MRSAILCVVLAAACSSGGNGEDPPQGGSDLSGFRIERLLVGAVEFEVWIAETAGQRAQGFMNATAEQTAPLPDGTSRGMLFTFPVESFLSFWMRDTFIPLDLAYANATGRILEVHSLIPLNETPVPASTPVQFALEAPAGTFASRGIGVGTVIDVP